MSEKWANVNHALRCPWCGGADRCTVTRDWSLCLCRTPDQNTGEPRYDEAGQPYWTHRLTGQPSGPLGPAPTAAAADLVLHEYHEALLERLSLLPRHRDNLRERFGAGRADADLPEIDSFIDRADYRSTPGAERLHIATAVAEAMAAKHGEEVLTQLPGLYQREDGAWTLAMVPGMLIPVRTPGHLIVALKLRRDEPDDKGHRYIYVSSARFGGASARLHVHTPLCFPSQAVRVTEGELKADVATFITRIPTLSLPGVASWRRAFEALHQLAAGWGKPIVEVRVAFDLDARVKKQVAAPLEQLCRELLECSERYDLIIEVWDEALGKGVDDALAGDPDSIETLEGEDAAIYLRDVIKTAGLDDQAQQLVTLLERLGREHDLRALFERETLAVAASLSAAEFARFEVDLREMFGRDYRSRDFRRAVSERNTERREESAAREECGPKPRIETFNREQEDISEEAVAAMERRNHPPRLFRFDKAVARVTQTDRLIIEALDVRTLRAEMERAARWTRSQGQGGPIIVPCPKDTVEDLLSYPELWNDFPRIRGIISSPCYAPNGALVTEAGYNAASGLFYQPGSEGVLDIAEKLPPAGPETDWHSWIEWAKMWLDTMLYGFPWDGPASRAHAVGLLILPFVRFLIDGNTPLHVVDAPREGSGKGLLVDALTLPYVPAGVPTTGAPRREEEWEKMLSTLLIGAPGHIFLDNLSVPLQSEALARALTSRTITGRILGTSRQFQAPVNCVWVLTGNNVIASPELTRRMVKMRMDPQMERPTDRTFHITDLRAWVIQYREYLVQAVLALCQCWIAAGRPHGDRVLASYTEWSHVIGGILKVAGYEGFLAGNAGFEQDETDDEDAEWRSIVSDWYATFGEREVSAAEIYSLVSTLGTISIPGYDEASRLIAFGVRLRRKVDVVLGGKAIRRTRTISRSNRYILKVVDVKRHAEDVASRAGL